MAQEKPMSFIPADEDKKFIRRIAAEADTSMSDVARAIVRYFMSQHFNGSLDLMSATVSLTPFLDKPNAQTG